MAQESFDALAEAVKLAESRGQRFDPKNPSKLLTSPAGAEGEMQVLPRTQRDPGFGVAPAKDRSPSEIARVGKDYLKAMLDRYGNEQHALVAYNWGPKNADSWLASGAKHEKLPSETQKYIQKVQEYKGKPLSTGARPQKVTENALQDAGPSYKAALAMSFLVDDKDAGAKKGEEDIFKDEEGTQMAEAPTPRPLEGLDLAYSSPFPAEKQPVFRAQGSSEQGEVADSGYRSVLDRPEMTRDMSDPRYRAYLEKKQAIEPDFTDLMVAVPAGRAIKTAAQELAELGVARTPGTSVNIGENLTRWDREFPPLTPSPGYRAEEIASSVKNAVNQAFERAAKTGYRMDLPLMVAKEMAQRQKAAQEETALQRYMQEGPRYAVPVPFVKRADGSPESGETYNEKGMKTEYSNAPKRSAKEMLAYMQSQNPSVTIDKFPMDENTMGYVNSRMPDVINLNTQQSPAREERTKLHELEHSMALRSGDILGRPNVSGQDNAYRAYHLMNKDWTQIRQFAHNMASNKDKLEKFFGQPMDSGYLNVDPETLDKIRNRGDALQGLAEEQMASLSALEQTTGKFLTQDPEMRKLFPSTKMMAVYDALTGPRQTRMDARDLPPHTPVPSYMYQDNPVLRFIQKHTTDANEYGIPIKRADGSPETGEMSKPFLGNPNIQRQGAAARRLASMRDVNTLPDPKTYAAVSGFLGTPYEEQGWSVLHPQKQGIQNAADVGFTAGTAAQIAPVVGPAAKALAKMTGSVLNERLLQGQSLIPGFNTPAPVNFAVRPQPGGYFLHSRLTGRDDVESFLNDFIGVAKEDDDPLKKWMYKRYSNYMRGQMGTEMDPLVKGADQGKRFHFMDEQGGVHMPLYADHVGYVREQAGLPKYGFAKTQSGEQVEKGIDASINPIPIADVGERNLSPQMEKLQGTSPDTPVYELLYEELDDVLQPVNLRSSLNTMMTDKSLPPEYRLTVDQLNKMTLPEASEKVAQFDAYMTAKEQNERMRAASNIPVYKQYGDGSKWYALEDTAEDANSHDFARLAGKNADWCTKDSSSCMSHGADDGRLFILSDSKGKPMVQINSVNNVPLVNDWLRYALPPYEADQIKDSMMLHQIEKLPAYQQWAKENSQLYIDQIRGRHNNRSLEGDELEKARDFVRSRDWSRVEELSNIGLIDIREEALASGRALDMKALEDQAKQQFGTFFLTPEELKQLGQPYKKGGIVERNNNDARTYI